MRIELQSFENRSAIRVKATIDFGLLAAYKRNASTLIYYAQIRACRPDVADDFSPIASVTQP